WISLSQPWKGNDLHWLKLMRTSFRFSDEESESDDASMAASMDSEGEVAFVHGIDAVLDMPWATTSCQSKEDKISSVRKSTASAPATAQEDRWCDTWEEDEQPAPLNFHPRSSHGFSDSLQPF
ncbi:hypothetical protein P4O66_023131, partial [Electrophorus voltai]